MKKYKIISIQSLVALAVIALGSRWLIHSCKDKGLEDKIGQPETEVVEDSSLTSRFLRASSIPSKAAAQGSSIDEHMELMFGAANEYLRQKDGFRLEVDNLVYKQKYTGLPPIRLFLDLWGKEHKFDIFENNKHVMETLEIRYFNEGATPVTRVRIEDAYHDGIPSEIYIADSVNNTRLYIRQDKYGNITYDDHMIDEAGAKGILEWFGKEYAWFRESTNLAEKIEGYSPKIHITEQYPFPASTMSDLPNIDIGQGDPNIKMQIEIDPNKGSTVISEIHYE